MWKEFKGGRGWSIFELKNCPGGKAVLVKSCDPGLMKDWGIGAKRNEQFDMRWPAPDGVQQMCVALYMNREHNGISITFAPVVDASGAKGEVLRKLWNGDVLVAVANEASAEMAGWLAAAWMARWVPSKEEMEKKLAETTMVRAGSSGPELRQEGEPLQ